MSLQSVGRVFAIVLIAVATISLTGETGAAQSQGALSGTCGFCAGETQCTDLSYFNNRCINQCGLPYAGACIENGCGTAYIVCYAVE